MNTWIEAIQKVGFPIFVACIAMWFVGYMLVKQLEEQTKILKEIRDLELAEGLKFETIANKLSGVEKSIDALTATVQRVIETRPFRSASESHNG